MEIEYRRETRRTGGEAVTALWVVAASLFGPADSHAAQSRQERGAELIQQTLAALGGDKFLNVKDRVEEGRAYSFYRESLSGLARARIYSRYLTRPEPPQPGFFGVRERQSFGKEEESAVLFTETDAWQITFRGARPAPDDLRDRFRDSMLRNIFYILKQRRGEPGLLFESQGSDVVDNQPVDIVEIADADNRTVTVYLHRSTHLPIKQVYVRRDPKTRDRIDEVTLFSKYREVSGIQWPYHVVRERNGEKIFEMFAETVSINQGLTDELFTLPANLKILKKE